MSEERKTKGWKIATLAISIALVAVVTTLAVVLNNVIKDRTTLGNSLENIYQRAYYELIADVNAMEINYSKLLVSNSRNVQIEQLNEIAKHAQFAGESLSTLSQQNHVVSNTTRFINQSGDFASYLMMELVDGNSLSEDDYDMLNSLYKMTIELGRELSKINDEIAKGNYNFTNKINVDDDIFTQVFTKMEEMIVELPSLIYDGPFSDASLEREAKAITGDAITPDKGVEMLEEMLKDFGVKNITYKDNCNSYFEMFKYEGETEDGDTVYLEISKKGGKLIMMNVMRSVNEPNLSPEDCAELAEQYLEAMGYQDMKSVWVSNYNSIIYVNLAPVVNDIVWYPDLIKVKIASNDGSLIGLEALQYSYNHTERNLPEVTISESEARASISPNITIETSRLALIPYRGKKELLTYEFSGYSGDSLYYVYVDALTGKEVRVLRVIDSDEGTLLM